MRLVSKLWRWFMNSRRSTNRKQGIRFNGYRPVHWSPPPDTCFKGNFDTTLFDSSNCAGIGVVFRDSSRNVIASLSQWIDHTSLVELAKVLASRRAMVLARELSLFDVIFKGDCLRIIQALKNSGSCKTPFGHVIEETK